MIFDHPIRSMTPTREHGTPNEAAPESPPAAMPDDDSTPTPEVMDDGSSKVIIDDEEKLGTMRIPPMLEEKEKDQEDSNTRTIEGENDLVRRNERKETEPEETRSTLQTVILMTALCVRISSIWGSLATRRLTSTSRCRSSLLRSMSLSSLPPCRPSRSTSNLLLDTPGLALRSCSRTQRRRRHGEN